MALPFYDIGSKSLARLRDVSQGITLRKQEKLREKGQRLAEARLDKDAKIAEANLEIARGESSRRQDLHELSMEQKNLEIQDSKDARFVEAWIPRQLQEAKREGLSRVEAYDRMPQAIADFHLDGDLDGSRTKLMQGLMVKGWSGFRAERSAELTTTFERYEVCKQSFKSDDGLKYCMAQFKQSVKNMGPGFDPVNLDTLSEQAVTGGMTSVVMRKDALKNRTVYNFDPSEVFLQRTYINSGTTEEEKEAIANSYVQIVQTPHIKFDGTKVIKSTIKPISNVKLDELLRDPNPGVRKFATAELRRRNMSDPKIVKDLLKSERESRGHQDKLRADIALVIYQTRMRYGGTIVTSGGIKAKVAQESKRLAQGGQPEGSALIKDTEDGGFLKGIIRLLTAPGHGKGVDGSTKAAASRLVKDGRMNPNATLDDIRVLERQLKRERVLSLAREAFFLERLGVPSDLTTSVKVLLDERLRVEVEGPPSTRDGAEIRRAQEVIEKHSGSELLITGPISPGEKPPSELNTESIWKTVETIGRWLMAGDPNFVKDNFTSKWRDQIANDPAYNTPLIEVERIMGKGWANASNLEPAHLEKIRPLLKFVREVVQDTGRINPIAGAHGEGVNETFVDVFNKTKADIERMAPEIKKSVMSVLNSVKKRWDLRMGPAGVTGLTGGGLFGSTSFSEAWHNATRKEVELGAAINEWFHGPVPAPEAKPLPVGLSRDLPNNRLGFVRPGPPFEYPPSGNPPSGSRIRQAR